VCFFFVFFLFFCFIFSFRYPALATSVPVHFLQRKASVHQGKLLSEAEACFLMKDVFELCYEVPVFNQVSFFWDRKWSVFGFVFLTSFLKGLLFGMFCMLVKKRKKTPQGLQKWLELRDRVVGTMVQLLSEATSDAYAQEFAMMQTIALNPGAAFVVQVCLFLSWTTTSFLNISRSGSWILAFSDRQ
jgi:hypothetical protein